MSYLINVPFRRVRMTIRELLDVEMLRHGTHFVPLVGMLSTQPSLDFNQVMRIRSSKEPMPPIRVLQTDKGYIILDGHHRACAALFNGNTMIQAIVEVEAAKQKRSA